MRALRERFEHARIVMICDASLRHRFRGEERRVFDALLQRDDFINVRYADPELLGRARQNPRSVVVSNDLFRDEELHTLCQGVAILGLHRSASGVSCHPNVTISTPGLLGQQNVQVVPLRSYVQRINRREERRSG